MSAHLHKKGDIVGGRYAIATFRGEGGMQQVYRADDSVFSRKVALKTPKNPSGTKRFKRSAIVSARVNHPNVAKTLDYISVEDDQYLIEEYINGVDLREFIDVFFCLDPYLAGHLFHHIVKGVAASHRVGVFHRDLKPSNVMISRQLWPELIKVTDFGIAKMAQEELEEAIELGIDKSVTTSATLVGALPYMAPEMILDPKGANLPADIWALGAMLFEFMTGMKPFGAGHVAIANIIGGKLSAKPEPPNNSKQFQIGFDNLWELVLSCLKKKPEDRPTADHLVAQCSDLCYSLQDREVGTVKRYGSDVGDFGFIRRSGQSDVFFHHDSFYGTAPAVGQIVAFASFASANARRAHPVLLMKPNSQLFVS
jgi:serine/threonine protein kinase